MASGLNYSEDDFGIIAGNDFRIATEIVSKNSYNIGITDGRESASQIGFDQGFEDGLSSALSISKFKTFVNILKNSKYLNDQQLIDEITSFDDKWPKNATDFVNGSVLDQLDESTKDITPSQREQMRSIELEIKNLFPRISSYLLNDEYNQIKYEI